ncbi:MAG: STAS domain-containing protein [Armatimonadota bacterium]|nr:STAS domain-containing protein [bacterium]
MSISGSEEIFTTWASDLDEHELSTVCLCGELDASSAPAFISDMKKIISRRRNVIMDVHLLDYIDSTGVAAIISTKNAIEATGHKLGLVGCHGLLTKILHITRIEDELRCFEDIDQAIAGLKLT